MSKRDQLALDLDQEGPALDPLVAAARLRESVLSSGRPLSKCECVSAFMGWAIVLHPDLEAAWVPFAAEFNEELRDWAENGD